MSATKTFTPPYEDPNLELGDLLKLELHLFGETVEDITDQAQKEEKMETTLETLENTWGSVVWATDPYVSDSCSDVELVRMSEEDFETLETELYKK